MEKKLYEAAIEGSLSTLKTLVQKDPLILDRITSLTFFHETPLHVAVLRGHLEFTRALLSHNPQLAAESDSLGRLPLHLAAAKGHVEIIRELIRVGPGACVARDKDGMAPLHVAIMKGARVEGVSELTRSSPESTRLTVGRGETVYHLCVKYNNLEALNALMEELLSVGESDNINLLNAKDDDGNTVFHLATLHRHLKIMKNLLTKPGIDLNVVNKNGITALDMAENAPRDMQGLEVLNFLLESNAQGAANSSSSLPSNKASPSKSIHTQENNARPNTTSRAKSWTRFFTFDGKNHLEKFRGEIFIVSAIIVLITALPIINMKINGPTIDDEYITNTWSLVPALAIMILLVSGLPLKNKFCVWLVLQLMYTAIGFLGLNYIGSILSNESRYFNINDTLILMFIWFGLLIVVSLLNMIRLVVLVVTSISACMKRRKSRAMRGDVSSNV